MSDERPTTSPSWTKTRARIAGHHRNHPTTEPPAELYRDHAAARIEDYVRRVVGSAPPLSPEQRDKIATLLRGPDVGGAA